MSLYALSWAFGLTLPPNEKIVLLALADCENDETLQCNPGQKHLAAKASVSERTVRAMLNALEARELLVRERQTAANGGRITDNYRLACRGLTANPAGGVTGKSEGGYRQTVAGIENRKEPEDSYGPVSEVTTEGPVDNSEAGSAGDGRGSIPTPTTLARFHGHAVSTPDVFASVGEILAPTHLDDEGLLRLADEIIRKSPTRVLNPTAYVVTHIRDPRSQFEWVARAWAIAGDLHLERAERKAS